MNPELDSFLENPIFNKVDIKGAARTELYNDDPNLTTVLNIMATWGSAHIHLEGLFIEMIAGDCSSFCPGWLMAGLYNTITDEL